MPSAPTLKKSLGKFSLLGRTHHPGDGVEGQSPYIRRRKDSVLKSHSETVGRPIGVGVGCAL
jgi:hypothetical protein